MDTRSDDHPVTTWMHGHSRAWLRASLGLIYIWFGAPKLVAGLSPAEDLVRATVPWFDPAWFVPALGLAEVLIGLCLWRPRWLRVGLVLMALHMVGTVLPLITLPELTWRSFPVLTLEGQYILKNAVLVAGAMVLAGTRTNRARSRGRAPLASASRSRTMRRAQLRPLGPQPSGRPGSAVPFEHRCKPASDSPAFRLALPDTGAAAPVRRIAVSLRA
jgi:hypothetical protein